MEKTFPEMKKYKRRLAHGMIYRKIKKVNDADKRIELSRYLSERLGGKASDLKLFHLNKYLRFICPWLVTIKRDRLKLYNYIW